MKKLYVKNILLIAGGLLSIGLSAFDKNTAPTPYALPSQMQTHLRIDVKDDTKELYITQDQNDPDIITKAYVLKHADPYELRPYLRSAARPESVKGDRAKVECIKYNDGTGIIIVSAEAYRFGKQENGMGFDEMIEILDKPNISSSSGSESFVYFPKYNDAKWLAEKIKKVGMNISHDDKELDGGKDKVVVDPGLNGLLFYVPVYSIKNIKNMLKVFDLPTPEVKIKYTIYELSNENDGTLGVDFQAWKNGPGSDVFSIGSKFTNGWDAVKNIAQTPSIHDTRTQFFKFSPRWNSKFLDFLAVKGKASVITSGELSIMNNKEGVIETTTKIAGFKDGEKIQNIETFGYYKLTDARIYDGNTDYFADDTTGLNAGRYRLKATDDRGNNVTISLQNQAVPAGQGGGANPYRGDMTITRVFDGNRYYYGIQLDEDAARAQGVVLVRYRRDNQTNLDYEVIGYRVEGLSSVSLEKSVSIPTTGVVTDDYVYRYEWQKQNLSFSMDQSDTIYRDFARVTNVSGYGFFLSMIPNVSDEMTVVDVYMNNTSLIGFDDAGNPRTAKSEVQNKFMINNKGERLVVGGIDKYAVVRSVAKVPYLGDLPILGWLLSSESEVSKKNQIVAVLDCKTVMPENSLTQEELSLISEIKEKLKKSGGLNKYGFDQFILDEDKNSFDPLP